MVSLDEFRAKVRSELADRIPLERPGERFLQWDDAGSGSFQGDPASLWEGGIAGITVPVEYGGLGLSARPSADLPRRGGRLPDAGGVRQRVQRGTPDPARPRQRGAEEAVHSAHPQRGSHLVPVPVGAERRFRPGRIVDPGRNATAIPGESTGRRSGPPVATTRTMPSAWLAPTWRCQSTRASPCSSCP